jgi:hypothetical protein
MDQVSSEVKGIDQIIRQNSNDNITTGSTHDRTRGPNAPVSYVFRFGRLTAR